jgi:uncharacterized protein YjbI with pentapeptide repeats
MKGANLTGADLENVHFSKRKDLDGATLDGVNLDEAIFEEDD